MDINKQLIELYKSKFRSLAPALDEYNLSVKNPIDKATNPLMLMVNDDWINADIKIMILGQENNIWGGELGQNGAFCGKIEEVINIYNFFYLNKKRKYGPYWNEFNRITRLTNKEGKKISFLWNNIVKIGRLGMGCVPAIHKITNEHFNVVTAEIEILKPNLLIFLTGPDYDNKIIDALGGYSKIRIDDFDEKQICELKFNANYDFRTAIRTYHPNYLYLKGNSVKNPIIQKLQSTINNNI